MTRCIRLLKAVVADYFSSHHLASALVNQRSLRLALVRPLHFVIVDATKLDRDFATLVKADLWQDKLPTNALLISGPSKTADIQQTLAYGAYEPRELVLLLLNS